MTERDTIRTALAVIALAAGLGCSDNTAGNEPEAAAQLRQQEHRIGANTIEVERVAGKGVIRSVSNIAVYSLVDGVLTDMHLSTGQKVRQGQVLAQIDRADAMLALLEYESALEKKAYEVQTTLLGLGYRRDSLDQVPSDIRKRIEVMTGYAHEQLKVENQKKLLEHHTIKAPVSGSITDIKVGSMGYVHKGDPLFYVMDTDNLVVQFEVLETLLPIFNIGMPLEFSTLSYGNKTYNATLVSIAPKVEESGMIKMVARVEGQHPELRPGMTTFVNY